MLKRCILGLVVLAVGLGLFSQQEKKVQSLLQIFPRDALVYLELRDFQDGLAKLKSYVAKAIGQKKYLELRQEILDLLEDLPEKGAKNILPGLRSVERIVFAVYKDGVALGIRTSSPKLLKNILDAFEDELYGPEIVEGAKVYELELDDDSSAYITVLGRYLLATTKQDLLRRFIKRYKAGDVGDGIHTHRYYREAKPDLPRDAFSAAGFWDIKATIRLLRRTGERRDIYEFDRSSAVFGWEGFESLILKMQWDSDGAIKRHCNFGIKPGTAIYELIRQRPAGKETLRFVPAGALGAFALTIEDPKRSWEMIRNFIEKNGEFFGTGEDIKEELEEFKEDVGVGVDEIAGILGDEVTMVFDSPTIFHFQAGGMAALAILSFVVKLKDRDKAGKVLGEISQTIESNLDEKFKEKKYKGVSIKYIKVEKALYFAYAFVDSYLIAGFSLSMVRDIIKAYKDGRSIADKKAFQEALSKVPAKNTVLTVIDFKKLYSLFSLAFAFARVEFRLPSLSKDFRDSYMISAWVTGKKGLQISSHGLIDIFSPTVMAFMAFSLVQMRMVRMVVGQQMPEIQREKRVEAFKLPEDKDEAEKVIKTLIQDLSAKEKEKREEATRKLKGAGRVVIPHVKPLLTSSDVEVKKRAKQILLYLGEFDGLPEAVDKYIEECMDLLDNERLLSISTVGRDFPSFWPDEELWRHILKDKHFKVTKSAVGRERFAEVLAAEDISFNSLKNGAWYVYTKQIPLPAKPLVKLLNDEEDENARLLLTLALAFSDGEVADEYLVSRLGDEELPDPEMACVHSAIEKRSQTHIYIPRLICTLKSEDEFKRFNAGLTLFRLTPDDSPAFNAFQDEKARAKQIEAWEGWWARQN